MPADHATYDDAVDSPDYDLWIDIMRAYDGIDDRGDAGPPEPDYDIWD